MKRSLPHPSSEQICKALDRRLNPPMNSLEKWHSVTSSLISPQSFIDFSWYFTVGTFLSRRVWKGDLDRPLCANLFVVPVGLAGIGKSLTVSEVKKLILSIPDTSRPPIQLLNGQKEQPTFIKLCANSTNFSSMIEEMARSTMAGTRLSSTGKKLPYFYTPFSIIEDEMSAFVRAKEGGQLIKALLKFYDCETYEYQTRIHQKEKVPLPFTSMLCSTTPSFLIEAHRLGLFADGFSSRTIWLFEGRPRFYISTLEPYSIEQLKLRQELIDRLKAIAKLNGPILVEPELREYIDAYYKSRVVHDL